MPDNTVAWKRSESETLLQWYQGIMLSLKKPFILFYINMTICIFLGGTLFERYCSGDGLSEGFFLEVVLPGWGLNLDEVLPKTVGHSLGPRVFCPDIY